MATEPLCQQSSFSFSSETISQIAARVIHELHLDDDDPIHTLLNSWEQQNDADHHQNDDDDDFSFPFLLAQPHSSSPVSADDIFRNGHIIPKFPLSVDPVPAESPPRPRRLPLMKLMIETEGGGGFGGGGAGELDGVADGSYCVWTPPLKKVSSSKRWRLRDLLHRSHSDASEKRISGGNGGGAAAVKGLKKKKLFSLPHRHQRWVVQ